MSQSIGDRVREIFRDYKDRGATLEILDREEQPAARLRTIGEDCSEGRDDGGVELLTRWRNAQDWVGMGEVATVDSTRAWVRSQLIEREDRILFWIETLDGTRVGHVGLNRFAFAHGFAEMDNLIRGRNDRLADGMVGAYRRVVDWAHDELGVRCLFADLMAENKSSRLVSLFCGFRELYRVPLARLPGEPVRWRALGDEEVRVPDLHRLIMYRIGSDPKIRGVLTREELSAIYRRELAPRPSFVEAVEKSA